MLRISSRYSCKAHELVLYMLSFRRYPFVCYDLEEYGYMIHAILRLAAFQHIYSSPNLAALPKRLYYGFDHPQM